MIPSDPLYAQQWHFDHLGNIEKIWDEFSGAGIHVGVYDTGVDTTHPDLAGNYDASRHFVFNSVTQSGNVNTATQTDARSRGHGTAVAGIIGADLNGQGAVGIAWGSTLTSVNIADPSKTYNLQTGSVLDFAEAIGWSSGHFDVINNSWNTRPIYDPNASILAPAGWATVNDAFADVSEFGRNGLGTVVVQGVGNDNLDAQGCGLNGSRFTITVGGFGSDGFAAEYSNYGACILVTAPTRSTFTSTNDEVVTTDLPGTDGYNGSTPDGYTDEFGGTSATGPMVTGIVALMLDANPNLGWRDVQNILAASARHTGSDSGDLGNEAAHANENDEWFFNGAANWNGGGMHFSNDYGYGAVDAYAAVRMAEVWSLFTIAQTTANEKPWYWNDPSVALNIQDNDTTDYTFAFPTNEDRILEAIEVEIGLTHTDFTQLEIYVISPGGTTVQIYDGSGGTDATADGGLNWVFGIDALRGEHIVGGDWTIRIVDTESGDGGTLDEVYFGTFGADPAVVPMSNDVYHYTDEFLAMKALSTEGARATLADTNGGTDWIDAAAVTGNVALNLNAGALTKVNGANWFTIAGGTTIEHGVTGDGNDTLTGNGVANKLYGMRGNDTLDGGLGNDQMFGGKGSDTYVVSQSGDVADDTGGNGANSVKAGITFSLNDTVHAKGAIEHLTLTGTGAINATGNGSANTLTGNAAANTLDGLGNNDTMRGLGGNDTYVVAQSGDIADETGGSGVDLVKSALTFSLVASSRLKGSVENLTLTGSGKIDATGNALANLLIGNAGMNVINGGAGNNRMTGGANADTFVFDAALNRTSNVDHITDFLSGTDALRLDASVFAKLKVGDLKKKAFLAKDGAEKAKDKFDRVIYDTDSGELRFDKDGKGKTKAVLFAVLDGGPDLAHTDVLVVA